MILNKKCSKILKSFVKDTFELNNYPSISTTWKGIFSDDRFNNCVNNLTAREFHSDMMLYQKLLNKYVYAMKNIFENDKKDKFNISYDKMINLTIAFLFDKKS